MHKTAAIVDTLLFHFISAALGSVVAICFLQVTFRYVFNTAFAWAEEISIVILIWATWGGACLSVRRGKHLQILFLVDKLSAKKQSIIQLLTNLLAVLFLAYIGTTSKSIIENMSSMTLLSLPSVPINVMYYSVPAGCAMMIYCISFAIYADIKIISAFAMKEP